LTALNVRAQCGYEWRNIGFVDGDINAMVQWDPDGTGPKEPLLVVGGVFNTVAGVPANRVACFDGTSWQPMPGLLPSGFVNAMTVWNGDLIIGGSFTISGSGTSAPLARWTGTEWALLPPVRALPRALAVWNGDLYLGGDGLLKLKDGTWHVVDPTFLAGVSALLTIPDGLAIGGTAMRLSTQGPRFRAAIWNGSSIQPLISPDSSDGETWALLWHGGRLHSTGYVQIAGPPGALVGVLKWEDNQWILVGDQLSSHVYSIAAREDQLFVGGVFGGTSSTACSRFARLDGDRWKAVAGSFPGSLSSQGVYSILPTENGLFVAGRRLSNSVVWMNAIAFLAISPSPDFNTDSFVNDLDFSLFAVAYGAGSCGNPNMPSGCPADINADGFVDDLDFQLFAAAYDRLICP
jgi:hypothetical protein